MISLLAIKSMNSNYRSFTTIWSCNYNIFYETNDFDSQQFFSKTECFLKYFLIKKCHKKCPCIRIRSVYPSLNKESRWFTFTKKSLLHKYKVTVGATVGNSRFIVKMSTWNSSQFLKRRNHGHKTSNSFYRQQDQKKKWSRNNRGMGKNTVGNVSFSVVYLRVWGFREQNELRQQRCFRRYWRGRSRERQGAWTGSICALTSLSWLFTIIWIYLGAGRCCTILWISVW